LGPHAKVVILEGQRSAEACLPGSEERWGVPVGVIGHRPETLHHVRSIPKSGAGFLYGIAVAHGAVPAPDTPMPDLFPA